MPYTMGKDMKMCSVAKPWAVKNARTGAVVPGGCHPTQGAALAHQRALTLNVPDANPMGARSGIPKN